MVIGFDFQLKDLNFPGYCNLDNNCIQIKSEVRNLGVLFDKNVSMKNHLKCVKSKVISNLINISRTSKFLNKPSLMKLVHGLILSKMDFFNYIFF